MILKTKSRQETLSLGSVCTIRTRIRIFSSTRLKFMKNGCPTPRLSNGCLRAGSGGCFEWGRHNAMISTHTLTGNTLSTRYYFLFSGMEWHEISVDYINYLVSLTHICSGLEWHERDTIVTNFHLRQKLSLTHIPYLSWQARRARPLWKTCHGDLWRPWHGDRVLLRERRKR